MNEYINEQILEEATRDFVNVINAVAKKHKLSLSVTLSILDKLVALHRAEIYKMAAMELSKKLEEAEKPSVEEWPSEEVTEG